MVTKVQKWGNSQGLRLNKRILGEAHIAVGDEVEVDVRDGVIVIEPVRRAKSLSELVAQIPKDYHGGEADWGEPQGREVW